MGSDHPPLATKMFHRRLRLLLIILVFGAMGLLARAAQLQILQSEKWASEAKADAERRTYFSARRGRLLDFQGREIARDEVRYDACVDYRAILLEPDPRWVRELAVRQAKKLPEWSGSAREARRVLIDETIPLVRAEVDLMWQRLGEVCGRSRSQMDDLRREILDKVARRREAVIDRRLAAAIDEFNNAPPRTWIERMIVGQRIRPERAMFEKESIADELSAHVILPALDIETYNSLRLELETLPGLSLKPSLARRYPFGSSASHVIGYVSAVNAEDLENDPRKDDPRKRYGINDRIGRDGLEKFVEDRLRGSRGVLYLQRGTTIYDAEQDTPGQDVKTTIDIELERDIEQAFKHVKFYNPDKSYDELSMNGAAVVIDIATGEVRALVSVPTYDPNRFEEDFTKLIADDLNTPLTNRALMTAMEPGSTVKPIVGLGAITQNEIQVDGTIECTGHLVLDGRVYSRPRCWTMSMFNMAHHSVPYNAPHPTGFLTFSDALERSCNIYFETLGDRLALEGLAYWMKKFGLGRPTGIGLSEARGAIPKPGRHERSEAWYAAIGQGPVLATPIQMANVAATIARDGRWMRPTLVVDDPPEVFDAQGNPIPDSIDLNLPKPALAAARKGMTAVVNSPAGTGDSMLRTDMLVAAKTGSASASKLTRYERDRMGNRIVDDDGKPIGREVAYGTRENPNPEIPWYRASDVDTKTGKARGTHGWAIGFAPADNPQIAFAVYVEYGNKGNYSAGSVVGPMLDACVKRGYLTPTHPGSIPTFIPKVPTDDGGLEERDDPTEPRAH